MIGEAMAKLRTPENADRICALLAEGYTLRQVAKEIGIESASSITDWVRVDEQFSARYARAMDFRCERMAEELLEISDDGSNDWMVREQESGEPITVADHEHIARSKLRVDSRKWLLSKMMPKKYGDRLAVAGDPTAPLNVAVTVEDKRAQAKALLDEAFGKTDG